MRLPDVNVLVYAYKPSLPDHARYRAWVEELVAGPAAFGVSELILSAFVRITTNRRVFDPPDPVETALRFADALRGAESCRIVSPGPRHWDIFAGLCRSAGAGGNLVADAYLAALAIESGSEWITTDRDFSRFPGLRWRHPLEG